MSLEIHCEKIKCWKLVMSHWAIGHLSTKKEHVMSSCCMEMVTWHLPTHLKVRKAGGPPPYQGALMQSFVQKKAVSLYICTKKHPFLCKDVEFLLFQDTELEVFIKQKIKHKTTNKVVLCKTRVSLFECTREMTFILLLVVWLPVSVPPVCGTVLRLHVPDEGGGAILPPGGGGRSPIPPEIWGRGLSLFLPCWNTWDMN